VPTHSRRVLFVLSATVVFVTACKFLNPSTILSADRMSADFACVRGWLPADSETILVANGPFWMSNFRTGDEQVEDFTVTAEKLQKQFQGLTLSLFSAKNDFLEKYLERKKVLFVIEGSRHFRSPTGLGETPFEGCALAIFQPDLSAARDAFMKDATPVAIRFDQIEGQKIAVFQEPSEQDTAIARCSGLLQTRIS
jgi:hypothetical protein